MKNQKKEINKTFNIQSMIFALLIPVFLVNFLIYTLAWNPPTEPPPGGNPPAFLSVSSVTQFKEGALGIGGVFQTDNETHLAINAGNVGIGTTTPTAQLDVDGEVKATSFTGDGSGLTNIDAGISGLSELSIDTNKNWSGYRITNVGEPTSSSDAATKAYVDASGSGYLSCPEEIESSDRSNADLETAISTCRGLAGDWYLPTAEELACFIGISGASSGSLWTRSPLYGNSPSYVRLRLTGGGLEQRQLQRHQSISLRSLGTLEI